MSKISNINNNIYESKGSYVVIERLVEKTGTIIGKVSFENLYRNYKPGDIIVYHIDDVKTIIIDKKSYDIILWYNVILREKENNIQPLPFKRKERKLEFTGLSADF